MSPTLPNVSRRRWARWAATVIVAAAALIGAASALADPPGVVALTSEDGLAMTADVYRAADAEPAGAPWIMLAHQAMSSRGEYREIGPRLAAAGYNAIAIDQRSGRHFGNVVNQTMNNARDADLETGFLSAIPDIRAGIAWADAQTTGPVALWGSSYSAALAIVLAAEDADRIDVVVAMSPGEYLDGVSVAAAAERLAAPTLVTAGPTERPRWEAIYEALPGPDKRVYAPTSGGAHGASALIPSRSENADAYWSVVEGFLAEHLKR